MQDWIVLALGITAWTVLSVWVGYFLITRFPESRQVAISPRSTAIIVAAVIPALGMVDLLFAVVGGNESTVSAVMLTIRVKYPLVAKSVSYSFGVFIGHVFFPSAEPVAPPLHEILARMVSGLGFTFYAIIITAAGVGENATEDTTNQRVQLIFALEMVAWHIVGGLVGRFWLCQHPLAGVEK